MSQGGGAEDPPNQPAKTAQEILAAAQNLAPADKDADEVLTEAKDVSLVQERPRDPVERQKQKVDLTLQRLVGYGGVALVLIQLGIANWVFIKYADHKGWADIPTGAIQAWLGATVVQVVALVLVIARSVFPEGGRKT